MLAWTLRAAYAAAPFFLIAAVGSLAAAVLPVDPGARLCVLGAGLVVGLLGAGSAWAGRPAEAYAALARRQPALARTCGSILAAAVAGSAYLLAAALVPVAFPEAWRRPFGLSPFAGLMLLTPAYLAALPLRGALTAGPASPSPRPASPRRSAGVERLRSARRRAWLLIGGSGLSFMAVVAAAGTIPLTWWNYCLMAVQLGAVLYCHYLTGRDWRCPGCSAPLRTDLPANARCGACRLRIEL